jgi:hypothetical protein
MSDYNRERASDRASEKEREREPGPSFKIANSCDLLYSTLRSRVTVQARRSRSATYIAQNTALSLLYRLPQCQRDTARATRPPPSPPFASTFQRGLKLCRFLLLRLVESSDSFAEVL